MSRVGRKPILIPEKVKVQIQGDEVRVEGPKGKLAWRFHPRMKVALTANQLVVERPTNIRTDRSLHGVTRSLLNNMVHGVTEGYTKELEIEGIGYKAQASGRKLVLNLGFTHAIEFAIPEGIEIKTPKPTQIVVTGIDRQKVGQVAADIRHFHEPEPYKGKGIHYVGEKVRRKQGKTTA
ncbi:MAG: 50S ribosomal protein L6 [Candidatus Omnitrophica bacterium]|nr:50S ribosomal protein L6 [Candidatus Omnitrophota bacterium]